MAFGFPNVSPRSVLEPFRGFLTVRSEIVQASFRPDSGFRNSFSQRSNYAYLGKRFDSDSYPVYLKLTGGLLQGYRGEYRDKIPLNRFGVAPAIIPSVGVRFGPLGSELVLLGNSAAMINLGLRL